jgi:galactokinase
MVLARAGKVATGALHADDLERNPAALPDVRQTPLPDDLRLLVIHSMTERSLSGAARADYTRNRFAYSMAMSILRRELEQEGAPADVCAKAQRLAMISEPRLGAWGTPQRLTALLKRVPAQASLEELRTRYGLEDLDALYEQSFGGLPGKQRPQAFDLRGPLVYGIAESRRAERFPEALRAGDYPRAGRLMNLGHDGDRRVDATGRPFYVDTSEAALDALVASGAGIEACPGSYRASSPVLDALVDAARFGGAYGACLTGAGIAGTVLALCHAEAATSVADRVSVRLASNDYARLAGWEKPPSPEAARDAVAVNASSAPAGEVRAATAPAR